ncbi:MAG: hypothetical protein R2770_15405 [Acidimicrobiales bacterium]
MDPHFVLDVRAEVPDSVHFDDLGDRLRLAAKEPISGIASGRFATPSVRVVIDLDDLAEGVSILGFAFTQFAMPVLGSRRQPIDFRPAPNLMSPKAMLPVLLQRRDGAVCLLAPIDSFHEQIITVDQDDEGVHSLVWGWHGDLDEVDEEFATTLGIYRGSSASEVLEQWFGELANEGQIHEGARVIDPVFEQLSYWTDNGAAYWYRTEPDLDITETIGRKLDELGQLGVAIGSVELDSWFYPHEIARPVSEVGYLAEVPPTGMLEWVPRPDVLPLGIEGLGERMGRLPMVLHARHICAKSPYLNQGDWWVDEQTGLAHPHDQRFFDRWFVDAKGWGATCIELDWMMPVWFGVREMRRVPGRAWAWQSTLDLLADEHDMALIWCMATPADLIAAAALPRVGAVRTSDDYRYAQDPARLWHWYLAVNKLVAGLGHRTFKDCFFTSEPGPDSIDGDPHREVEALLAAMSAGVVGIGDRIGRTDVAIVERICRPDGVIVGPDAPMSLADQSMFRAWSDPDGLCWATARSGDWLYVLALHTADTDAAIVDRFVLDHKMLVYDWRNGEASPDTVVDVELGRRDWALFVCCPIEERGGRRRALIGDPSRYATMGRQRVTYDGQTATASLAAGEQPARLRWWIEGEGVLDR